MKLNQVELMGWFGLTWEEKVADSTYKKTLQVDKAIAKKLKDFLQAGALNIRLIQNMFREYAALMALNYKPATFTNGAPDTATLNLVSIIAGKLNVDSLIVLNFLLSLQELSSAGLIPFSKWNPKGYKESTALQKTFESEKTVFEKAGKAALKTSTALLIIAGLGATAFLLYEARKV